MSTIGLQQVPTTYRGYTLDEFQIEAIRHVTAGESVLVSAPTGTGKTLIADYLIDITFRSGRQVVYTAPIKALSNQKFKEFKALLGDEHVGILTGDVVRRPDAPVLIMTTEIFRNLLHTDRGRLANTAYVIFDEIHYIDDPTRGSVWEESLIFLPEQMRFLGLSATIPNVDELARWIESIHGRPVRVVTHRERVVPLDHRLFEHTLGECSFQQLVKRYKRYASRFGTTASGSVAARFEPTHHTELVRHISPDLLPCLYFTFSRRRCEANARELAQTVDYLSEERKEEVRRIAQQVLERYDGAGEASVRLVVPLLERGIGYHHAGLLPVVKDLVEELFERRLLYVLYCTETFAVGLNFPCRTVCFDSVTKWDGKHFRTLSNREYFQMAGRAGRRGIDERGYVFTAVDFNFFAPGSFPTMREEDVEPLQSRFTLTYNTVLNLIKNYSREEIASILERNFASFQTQGTRRRLLEERAALEGELERLLAGLPRERAQRIDQYLQAKKGISRLEREIERRRKAGQRRGLKALRRGRESLLQQVNELEENGVDRGEVERFKAVAKEYRRQVARIERVERTLAELPPPDAYLKEFDDKRMLLEAMDYVREGELTARGLFAAEINGSELLVTELFFAGVFHDWEEEALCALAACIDYDPRRGEERPKHDAFDLGPVKRAVHLIESMEKAYLGRTSIEFNDHLAKPARLWSEGRPFSDVLAESGADEGDLVFGFRRAIDVLRQVRQAAKGDEYLAAKMSRCIERMDRDEVAILL